MMTGISGYSFLIFWRISEPFMSGRFISRITRSGVSTDSLEGFVPRFGFGHFQIPLRQFLVGCSSAAVFHHQLRGSFFFDLVIPPFPAMEEKGRAFALFAFHLDVALMHRRSFANRQPQAGPPFRVVKKGCKGPACPGLMPLPLSDMEIVISLRFEIAVKVCRYYR